MFHDNIHNLKSEEGWKLKMNKVKVMKNISVLIVCVLLLSTTIQSAFASQDENRQLSDQPSATLAPLPDSVSAQSTKNLTIEQTFWLFLNDIVGINTKEYAMSMGI
jgi:hypothetical protein